MWRKRYKRLFKIKKNEIIETILQLYLHATQEITNEQIENARQKHLKPVQHKKHEKHKKHVKPIQPVQSVKEMAAEVKRMRKERLKRMRQFRGAVMRH